MAVTILVKRERHLQPREVGDAVCTNCRSELRATRADFHRTKGFGPDSEHIKSPYLHCPVCDHWLPEYEFEWKPFREHEQKDVGAEPVVARITLYQKRLVERAESLRKFSVPNLGGDLAGHALEVQKIANELETLLSGGEIEE